MVVVLGADVHKKSHTFEAADANGRRLGGITVPATAAGHEAAIRWARDAFGGRERLWGLEDCRNMTVLLERDLLAAGERFVHVPTRLTARVRASARTRGKSDPIDALAVARAVLREPDLPEASPAGAARELKLLTDRRDDLVAERTRAVNRLRWHLLELDPARDPSRAEIARPAVRAGLAQWLGTLGGLVAELAAEILADIDRLSAKVDALAARIGAAVRACAPALLAIPGCGPLSAAKILGETAGITRFRSEACYAMFAGCAPIPVWSGNTAGRVRLNRGGNRQLNAALHRIAVTQTRLEGPGKDYYQRRRSTGDGTREALRCLKRQIAKAVYRALRT
ncbi:IS110 family transposase, partial [Sinomonas sp. G460-2]|uniref:IS110 family transposase n=1 Tax=Sinomonas sp. G460-2 TaxID=3393464 RepID=UPI0039EF062F